MDLLIIKGLPYSDTAVIFYILYTKNLYKIKLVKLLTIGHISDIMKIKLYGDC